MGCSLDIHGYIYIYILLKSMLIECGHFISKKIYYLEVHVQKTGQLHYPIWQIAKQC